MNLHLNPVPTEQTTALTDLLLAAMALTTSIIVWRERKLDWLKSRVWVGMFISLMLAGGLGALAHGLSLEEGTRRHLWQPLNGALAMTVTCFVAGAILDRWGAMTARRSFPGLVLVGAGFFFYATFLATSFLPFVLYEGVAMLFCLWVYGALALGRRSPGASWMAAGVVLTMVAAVIQATHHLAFTCILPFDANGIFHLVQLPALGCLLVGLRRGIRLASTIQATAAAWSGLNGETSRQGYRLNTVGSRVRPAKKRLP